MKLSLQACLFILGIGLLGSAAADTPSTTSSDNSPWQFEIAPYVWALNMTGTNTVGFVKEPINESFSDIFTQLNFAAMLYLDVSKGNAGVFFNTLYAITSDSSQVGPVNAKITNDFGVFTWASTYQVYEHDFSTPGRSLAITPYAGVRYTLDNTSLGLAYNAFNQNYTDNQSWANPIAGTRLNYNLTPKWSGVMFVDGGIVHENDYSYQVSGFLGYKPTCLKIVTLYAGYQYLYEYYVTGSGLHTFAWNMNIYGPVLGLSFTF